MVTPGGVAGLFGGGPANVPWLRALEGLSASEAARVPQGLPHSVAQVAAHVRFWQDWLLDVAAGGTPPWPEHAAGGWPDPGDWTDLRAALLGGQERLAALSGDEGFMAGPAPRGQSWSTLMASFAGHGVYHLGQVVLIRQALGLWPPPGGGDTW